MAIDWLNKAIQLSPYNLEFRNKLASTYASNNKFEQAEKEWRFILKENPKFIAAYTNLGYIKLLNNEFAEALRLFSIGEKLDPDNESLLLNLASFYLTQHNQKLAIRYLETILKLNPKNQKAQNALIQLKNNG